MVPETYWVTASSAIRLASSPLAPPPTPSATIARKASRSGPAMRCSVVGEAGLVDHHLLAQRADQEVVLVVGADLAGVGEAVDVDLVVEGLSIDGAGWRGHLVGGHGTSGSPKAIGPICASRRE